VPVAAYHVPKEYLATLSSTPLPLKEQGFFLPLWAERRPVFTDDVARDARFTHAMFRSFPHQSGLLLPLIVDDEVIGGFYLVWWTTRRRFSERDLRGLERIGEQVGFFLRNARLYEQAERNQRRLEVLNDVSRHLAADPRYDPAHKQGALAQGYRGFIGVPLNAHGHTVGTLNVFTRGARRFLPDEIALLSALADQASLAIEKAQLLRGTEEGRALL